MPEPYIARSPRAHLSGILRRFKREVAEKYAKGQKEHGGQLWKKPVFGWGLIREEILDLVVYYYTLQDQIEQVHAHLERGIRLESWGEVQRAYAILEKGHPSLDGLQSSQ